MPFPAVMEMRTGGSNKKKFQWRTPPLNGKCSTIHGCNVETATVSLLTGEGRAGGDGEAWVPTFKKVGY